MIANITLCVNSTRAGAGVPTFLLHTRQVVGALRVDQTFGAAADVRIADMLGDTLARASTVAFRTLGICSAWRGVARVHLFRWPDDNLGYQGTAVEWVACIALGTGTDGVVGYGSTSKIG